jgi:arabinose-5-phosphate isomerase
MRDLDFPSIAREVLAIEAEAIESLRLAVDERFTAVVEAILGSQGRVIICGIGKSGIIAKKIAATFSSTGTPSFFMHPSEAFHGDLGMVTSADVFLAVSHSGETDELIKLLPFLRSNGNLTIALTGNEYSTLAEHCRHHLSVRVPREACPLQLAPTASTTATLAMGDALAVALMRARDFQTLDFARFHPGGSLGRRLLHRVRDEMRTHHLPCVDCDAAASVVVSEITRGGLGVALVVDGNGGEVTDGAAGLLGIVTDGDLRRALERYQATFFSKTAADLMTPRPVTISADSNMQAAIELMAEHQITLLVVLERGKMVGVVQK